MRVIVTGGAGFIGSHIVDKYVELGHEVAVVDNLSTGRKENLNPSATLFEVDICSDDLIDAFKEFRPEVVLHEAAQVNVRKSVDDPIFDGCVNVLGSANVFRNAVAVGCGKVIYASSGGACYGDPPTVPADEDTPVRPLCPYGVSKYAAEKYLEMYGVLQGLRYTILRYANVYGPRQDPHGEAGVVAVFSELMLAGKQPQIFGDGSKTRDYVYVEDVAHANVLALEKGDGNVYNIGTGRETTDDGIFAAVRDALGVSIEAEHTDFRQGEVRRVALDASRAGKDLGWTAEVALDEGMAKAVAYYRTQEP